MLQTDAEGVFAIRDGSYLHITGPTGHGFSLIGNWKQKSVASGDAIQTTYSASGTVKLRSIVGDIPIPIPAPASVRVTTQPGKWGRYFGEIESIDLGLEFGPTAFTTRFGRSWGTVFNNNFAGADVRFQSYATTHRIHSDMLRDVNRWIMDAVGDGDGPPQGP